MALPSDQIKEILKAHRIWLIFKRLHITAKDLDRANAKTHAAPVDFHEAEFKGANLRSADISSARLQNADLRGANLQGTHFNDAELRGADLRGADLEDARFRHADLRGAKFDMNICHCSVLHGAKFTADALPWLILRTDWIDLQHVVTIEPVTQATTQ